MEARGKQPCPLDDVESVQVQPYVHRGDPDTCAHATCLFSVEHAVSRAQAHSSLLTFPALARDCVVSPVNVWQWPTQEYGGVERSHQHR